MIQEFDNNEVFSTDYLNIPPKTGDLAAIYEKGGRNLLMARDEEGVMTLPEATLFSEYWFDPDDSEADRKATNIRYYKSQPWGFASNLMIGCICDIEGSDEIEVHDTQEIAKAVWLTREQLTKPNSTVTLTDEMIAYYKYGESFREHLVV